MMKKNNFGFTLIELLAVVLMIGILTSIALPQYRKSVQRAEAMEALVNLKSLFDSAKRYRSANSAAPVKLNGLDISFYDADNENAATFNMGKYRYTFENNKISACRLNGNYCFRMYYRHGTLGRDALTCQVTSLGGKYDWICEALGYDNIGSNEYNMSKSN